VASTAIAVGYWVTADNNPEVDPAATSTKLFMLKATGLVCAALHCPVIPVPEVYG